jgi:hypothetical protein
VSIIHVRYCIHFFNILRLILFISLSLIDVDQKFWVNLILILYGFFIEPLKLLPQPALYLILCCPICVCIKQTLSFNHLLLQKGTRMYVSNHKKRIQIKGIIWFYPQNFECLMKTSWIDFFFCHNIMQWKTRLDVSIF